MNTTKVYLNMSSFDDWEDKIFSVLGDNGQLCHSQGKYYLYFNGHLSDNDIDKFKQAGLPVTKVLKEVFKKP